MLSGLKGSRQKDDDKGGGPGRKQRGPPEPGRAQAVAPESRPGRGSGRVRGEAS